jgi:hypothetical protein
MSSSHSEKLSRSCPYRFNIFERNHKDASPFFSSIILVTAACRHLDLEGHEDLGDIFPLSLWMWNFVKSPSFILTGTALYQFLMQPQIPTFQIITSLAALFYCFILWRVSRDIGPRDLSIVWGSVWLLSGLDSCWLRNRFSLFVRIAVVHLHKWTQALFHPVIGVLRLSSELTSFDFCERYERLVTSLVYLFQDERTLSLNKYLLASLLCCVW